MFCFPVVQPPHLAPPIPASLESELLTLLVENGFLDARQRSWHGEHFSKSKQCTP